MRWSIVTATVMVAATDVIIAHRTWDTAGRCPSARCPRSRRWPRRSSASRSTATAGLYEEKVDGWRMVANKDGARVRPVSRNGRDHTRRFADPSADLFFRAAS